MRTADLLSASLWILVGAYFVYAGQQLELGELRDPGSGFMIYWVGVFMAGLSIAVFVGALLRPAAARFGELWADVQYGRVARFVAALCVYALILPWFGFIPATLLLLVVLFRAVEPTPWWLTILLAVVATGACDLVFHRWLGIQMPAGIFDWG
jgi:putative tricarboxylic transport membrane protein